MIDDLPLLPFQRRHAGPSERFLSLTRNPRLRPPVRFEPTKKAVGDVVI